MLGGKQSFADRCGRLASDARRTHYIDQSPGGISAFDDRMARATDAQRGRERSGWGGKQMQQKDTLIRLVVCYQETGSGGEGSGQNEDIFASVCLRAATTVKEESY